MMRGGIQGLTIGAAALLGAAGCDTIWGVHEATLINVDAGVGGHAGAGGSGGTGGAGPGGADAGMCIPSQVKACYEGPTATEGRGLCTAGVATCNADGAGFGECVGQVMPQAETCMNPADEDCDGRDCVEAARLFGDSQNQQPLAVAVGANGVAYIVGSFSGSIKIDSVTLVEAGVGGGNGFLLAIDPSGKALWGKTLGRVVSAVSVDPQGNVIIGGFAFDPIPWGASAIETGLFAAEMTADGTPLWGSSLQGASGSAVNDVAASAGGVLIAGEFLGSIDVGDGPIGANSGILSDGIDGFVAYLRGSDGSGKAADGGWVKSFGDDTMQSARGVRADAGGNVFVAGSFTGAMSLGGLTMTSSGGYDIFVAKLDSSGALLWQKNFGDVKDQKVTGFSVDSVGTVAVAGTFQGSVHFDGSPLTSTTGSSLFVAVLASTNGAGQWARGFGTAGNVATAMDGEGNVLLAGGFTGSIDLGGATLKGTGTASDVFVAKLASDGAHLWSKRYGDDKEQAARGIAALSTGEAVVVGIADGSTDFGAGALATAGAWDGFVAKFGK